MADMLSYPEKIPMPKSSFIVSVVPSLEAHFLGVLVGTSVGGAENAFEGVERHVEQEQVDDDLCFVADFFVFGEVVEREQRNQIFVVVDVRKPFAEPVRKRRSSQRMMRGG
jgi:hypothetical protein